MRFLVMCALLYLLKGNECMNFPLKNCLTNDLDILFYDYVPRKLYKSFTDSQKEEHISNLHEVQTTIAETFFENGVVNSSESRIRFASITSDTKYDQPFMNWNFKTKKTITELMSEKIEVFRNVNESKPSEEHLFNIMDVYNSNGTFGRRNNSTLVFIITIPEFSSASYAFKRFINGYLYKRKGLYDVNIYFVTMEETLILSKSGRITSPFKINLILLSSTDRYGLDDVENTFNLICRPCLGSGAFSVQTGEGVACFKLGFTDGVALLPSEKSIHTSPNKRCFFSSKYKIPTLGTSTKMMNLEKKIFKKLCFDNMLLSKKCSNFSLLLHTGFNGFDFKTKRSRFRIKSEQFALIGEKHVYSSLAYFLIWHFPKFVNQNATSLDNLFESWKIETGGSVINIEHSHNASISHCLYEYTQSPALIRRFPSQPLAVPKPSDQAVKNAIERGNYFIILSGRFNDSKLQSKSNIFLETSLTNFSKSNMEERGLPDQWELPDNVDDNRDSPEFDCHTHLWSEHIPFTLLCDNNNDCSNEKDETACVKQTFLVENRMCKKKEMNQPCVFCQTIDGIIDIDLIYNHTCEQFRCPGGFVKCPQAYCIPVRYIEDGYKDCPYGEDEIIDYFQYNTFHNVLLDKMCHKLMIPLTFDIKSSQQSRINLYTHILESKDSYFCGHGEDKLLSRRSIRNNYQCRRNNVAGFRDKGIILHPDSLCDGAMDCPYGDDEQDCTICPTGLQCVGNTVTVRDASQVSVALSGEEIPGGTKLLNLSGIPLSNLSKLMNTESILSSLMDLRLKDCSLNSVMLPTEKYDGVVTISFLFLDLSRNNLRNLENSSIWIMNTKKLNLSGNSELQLKFSPSADFIKYCNLLLNGCTSNSEDGPIIFRQVKVLDLSFTSVGDNDLQELQRFMFLEEIYLHSCRISTLRPVLPIGLITIDLQGMSLDIPKDGVFSSLKFVAKILVENFEMCCPQILGETIDPSVCKNTIKESISSCGNLIENITIQTLLWAMGLLALLGNIVVIIYRCALKKITFNTTYGIFIFNLSVADLCMGIYLITIAVTGEWYKGEYYKHHKVWRRGRLCNAVGFLSTLSSEVSAFFILFVTIDRFLAVKFPLRQVKVTRVMAIWLSGSAWLVGIVISLIPILIPGWAIYSVSSICVGLPLTKEDYNGKAYSASIFILLNFIIFIMIAVGQYSIYKAKANFNEQSKMLSAAVIKNRYEADLAIARQLSLIVITDFLCWFPIGMMGVLTMSGISLSNDAFVLSAILIVPINSAINPLLYTVPALRQKWALVVSKFFKSVSHS